MYRMLCRFCSLYITTRNILIKILSFQQIARLLTVKRERELEEGIGKRLSRKLDRQWKKSIVVRPSPILKKLREEEAAAEAEKSA